jgi:glyoxylase-like metal-dependent hydrolase (beta-lactamase superfamily II)
MNSLGMRCLRLKDLPPEGGSHTVLLLAFLVYAGPAFAQIDLAGEWGARATHEDQVHRIPGAELGDFAGFPLNEAGKLKAVTWDASILSQPEQQARPHPAQYSMRGPGPNFRMNKVTDPLTNQLVAYTITGLFGNADRTIWMDGRPHPSPNAEHTWDGFSTGEWVDGNALKVTTTHMKAAFINRNGAPSSAKGTMTEFFFRHDLHLVLVTIIDDPVYLEEPFVRTSNFVWSPTNNPAPLIPFEIVDEVAGMAAGWVPSYPMGTRHEEFAKHFNLPFEATRGGAETMYPEYARRMRTDPRVTPRAENAGTPNTRPAPPVPPTRETLRVPGNVHMIVVDGVNVAVQVGEQGVLVVDTGRAGTSEALLAAVRAISPKPIRYVANTSADADHMGGNAELSRAGLNLAAINAPGNSGIPSSAAPIIAHEAVLNRVSAPTGEAAPLPFPAWPSSTFFGAKKTMALNGEGIEFIHVPSAHSDGDTLVYFRGSDVIVAGDVWSTRTYPVIDRARGGSVQGVLDGLNRIIDLTIPRFNQQGGTRVIPGHGRFGNESDVVEYRDMVTIVRDRIQLMARKGMTLEQVKAARPTLDYDGVYGAPEAFIDALFAEVSARGGGSSAAAIR